MADRYLLRVPWQDKLEGRAIVNALAYVYAVGTTNPITGTMYSARIGGVVVTNPIVIGNDSTLEVWLDTAQRVTVVLKDNNKQAYLADNPFSKITFADKSLDFDVLKSDADASGGVADANQLWNVTTLPQEIWFDPVNGDDTYTATVIGRRDKPYKTWDAAITRLTTGGNASGILNCIPSFPFFNPRAPGVNDAVVDFGVATKVVNTQGLIVRCRSGHKSREGNSWGQNDRDLTKTGFLIKSNVAGPVLDVGGQNSKWVGGICIYNPNGSGIGMRFGNLGASGKTSIIGLIFQGDAGVDDGGAHQGQIGLLARNPNTDGFLVEFTSFAYLGGLGAKISASGDTPVNQLMFGRSNRWSHCGTYTTSGGTGTPATDTGDLLIEMGTGTTSQDWTGPNLIKVGPNCHFEGECPAIILKGTKAVEIEGNYFEMGGGKNPPTDWAKDDPVIQIKAGAGGGGPDFYNYGISIHHNRFNQFRDSVQANWTDHVGVMIDADKVVGLEIYENQFRGSLAKLRKTPRHNALIHLGPEAYGVTIRISRGVWDSTDPGSGNQSHSYIVADKDLLWDNEGSTLNEMFYIGKV